MFDVTLPTDDEYDVWFFWTSKRFRDSRVCMPTPPRGDYSRKRFSGSTHRTGHRSPLHDIDVSGQTFCGYLRATSNARCQEEAARSARPGACCLGWIGILHPARDPLMAETYGLDCLGCGLSLDSILGASCSMIPQPSPNTSYFTTCVALRGVSD